MRPCTSRACGSPPLRRGATACRGLLLAASAVAALAWPAAASARSTEIVSLASGGSAQGNSASRAPSVSADGRYVAFESDASNLVPGDTNGVTDVFVRDRLTGVTTRASVGNNGEQCTRECTTPALSADGRHVTFQTLSDNLFFGDLLNSLNVFVRDLDTAKTEVVSVDSSGIPATTDSFGGPSISADGRYVGFASGDAFVPEDTNGGDDAYVRDRVLGTTERVSVTSSGAQIEYAFVASPWMSGDGRYVVIVTSATDLVPDDTNGALDVFVRDRQLATTERVSLTNAGGQIADNSVLNGGASGSVISDDGRYVTFISSASDVVSGDTNGLDDVFVRDRSGGGSTIRVSVRSDGAQSVLFRGGSTATMSADGQRVAFDARAGDFVAGDTNTLNDVFVHDLRSGTTERASVSSAGVEAGDDSGAGTISADGRYVVWDSEAPNLVAGDANGNYDVFLRDLAAVPSPALHATDPASPADDNAPHVRGSAPAGTVVRLYAQPDCSGAVAATGSAAAFASPGIAVTVADGSTTTFYATATQPGGDTSACSLIGIQYVQRSAPPAPPPAPPPPPATPPAAPPPPPPPPPGPAADRTAPVVKLSATAAQKLGATVRLKVSCAAEPCSAAVAGTVLVPRIGTRKAKTYRLAKVTRQIRGTAPVAFDLKVTRTARAAMASALRRGRRIGVRITVTATDAAGNATTITREIRLVRK